MDIDLLIVGTALALVWALVLALRVPASLAFLSLLVGQALASQLDLKFQFSDVVLILAPLGATMFLLKGRVAKSHLLREFVPALCVAVVTLSFLYPLIYALQVPMNNLTNYNFANARPWILVTASVIVLVFALLNYPRHHDTHHKKHR